MHQITVDGRRFEVEVASYDHPLRARAASRDRVGTEVWLQPWTCALHLSGLRRNLRVRGESIALDCEGYADEVLAQGRKSAPLPKEFRPLALWWALGLAPETTEERGAWSTAAPPDAEGWVFLGSGLRAQLRAWTWGQRSAAQRAHLHAKSDQLEFDPVDYLESMLAQCVIRLVDEVGAEVAVTSVNAQATQRLLAALTELNHLNPRDAVDPALMAFPGLADATLRVCAGLGWTPAQVWATPAVELERILALLDATSAHRAGRPPWINDAGAEPGSGQERPLRIADYPDAVVIRFDGGDG